MRWRKLNYKVSDMNSSSAIHNAMVACVTCPVPVLSPLSLIADSGVRVENTY